jgi:hypothetical protein
MNRCLERIVGMIDQLERTVANHLRHPVFAETIGMRGLLLRRAPFRDPFGIFIRVESENSAGSPMRRIVCS